jgi:hypothetical protein
VVQVPMTRKAAKRYAYYQTIHGKALATGFIGRTPRSAFDYVERNALLAALRSKKPLRCSRDKHAAFLHAIDALQRDGFRYVLVYGRDGRFVPYFEGIDPVHRERRLKVYRISDMRTRPPCSSEPKQSDNSSL